MDSEIEQSLKQGSYTATVKGTRQSGKSSLLVRLQHYAETSGSRTFYLDFQLVDRQFFKDLPTLFLYMAKKISREMKTTVKPASLWDNGLGAKDNLTYFIEETLLAVEKSEVVFFFDEVDRLFDYEFKDDFFCSCPGLAQ